MQTNDQLGLAFADLQFADKASAAGTLLNQTDCLTIGLLVDLLDLETFLALGEFAFTLQQLEYPAIQTDRASGQTADTLPDQLELFLESLDPRLRCQEPLPESDDAEPCRQRNQYCNNRHCH